MADIGPIMVDIIHPIMVVMVMAAVMVMAEVMVMAAVMVLPPLCTFKKRTARKLLQDHSPTIGTIAETQRVIIPMSKSAQTAGYQLPRSLLHSKD